MNMHRSANQVGRARTATLAISAVLLATGGIWACDDDDDDFDDVAAGETDLAYEYTYPYAYYYSGDLAYSDLYWSDAWAYDSYIYQVNGGTTQRQSIGNAIRALARGEQVCPGQVTVTPKTAPPACSAAGTTAVRSGGTIAFNGCQTADGSVINGTIDITASRSANEAVCSATTLITLSHTTTLSNLSVTGPDGRRLLIPNQTDNGTNTYTYGQLPTTAAITSSGRFQVFAADGSLTADINHNGTRNFTYSAQSQSYAVSGTVTTQDARTGSTGSLVGTDVTRTLNCCHPTGGTLNVTRTGGTSPGQHTWTFGPSCGQVSFDGTAITPPECL